jgi:hypothetical protein
VEIATLFSDTLEPLNLTIAIGRTATPHRAPADPQLGGLGGEPSESPCTEHQNRLGSLPPTVQVYPPHEWVRE